MKKRFHLIHVWGCVDPSVIGSSETAEERDEEAKKKFKTLPEEDALFGLDIDEEGNPTVFSYSNAFAEEE